MKDSRSSNTSLSIKNGAPRGRRLRMNQKPITNPTLSTGTSLGLKPYLWGPTPAPTQARSAVAPTQYACVERAAPPSLEPPPRESSSSSEQITQIYIGGSHIVFSSEVARRSPTSIRAAGELLSDLALHIKLWTKCVKVCAWCRTSLASVMISYFRFPRCRCTKANNM